MAVEFLENCPELRQFILSDVQLTGTTIGGGAYGIVQEVEIPVRAAAKTIYAFLQGVHSVAGELPKAAREFMNECQLLSKLRHPNIVQFLGLTLFPGSEFPALVMERLLTSLHDLLDPETTPPLQAASTLSFFSLALRISVLQDVGCGLAYLHDRNPPVIHRDLSARNILLDSNVIAKIGDLGMARIMRERSAATMTKGPGALVYMPPEAFAPAKSNKEKSKYDTSIDVFSLGVVTIFTIGGVFPCNPLEHTYVDESGALIARSELKRRNEYVRKMIDYLQAYGQYHEDHPLLKLVQQSLHNLPAQRPNIHEVQDILEEVMAGVGDKEIAEKKRDLVQAIQTQPMRKNLEHLLGELVMENTTKNRELTFTQQQLREKDLELKRAEETIRRGQQMILDKDSIISTLQQQIKLQTPQSNLYSYQMEGPGLTSGTINHGTHISLSITDLNGSPLLQPQRVSVQLQPRDGELTSLPVTMTSSSQYQISYTPVKRGQHEIHVQVNDRKIRDSPFKVIVYPDPRELGLPVKIIPGFINPRAIVINNNDEMIVSENWGHKLSVCSSGGEKIRDIGSKGDRPDQMLCPRGVAIDDSNNIYVTSDDKLQKFTSNGELIKCVGKKGPGNGEFSGPCGLAVYNNELYVCDCDNDRIQVFDLDLNFVQTIGSHGKGKGEFDQPYDIRFDAIGNMYIPEWKNRRVQVLDCRGQFLYSFGTKGNGKLSWATGLHIADKYVYISDRERNCILVYETSGQFVTSFGRAGKNDGEFQLPYYITSCSNGLIYICDWSNNRVQIF